MKKLIPFKIPFKATSFDQKKSSSAFTWLNVACFFLAPLSAAHAQSVQPEIRDGYKLLSTSTQGIEIQFTNKNYQVIDNLINGMPAKNLSASGMFLPNEAGSPDLPNNARFIALPQQANANLEILSFTTDTLYNIDIAPAPVIPLEQYDNPLVYKKNPDVYSKNEFYPAQPFQLLEKHEIRGVDVTLLGVSPFQYNPVSKILIVYKEVKLKVKFVGGNGHFGKNAFRSRWWDPILEDALLNYSQLPVIDYNKQIQDAIKYRATGCEYAIVIPNNPEFAQWADSVKKFRTEQGIYTQIYTLNTIGSTTASGIKTWVSNAYNTWTIKPAAVLLMADYGSNAASTITSNLYPHNDASYPNFPSDNYYADVSGDDLPDLAFSRMAANNATQLQVMCSKFLSYERKPPMDAAFYSKPITAVGWQDDRWFQLGGEIVGGYLRSINKTPVRVNALGSPASNTGNNTANSGTWSTASNTSTLLSYFGPSGLKYVPDKPGTLGGFSGGTSSNINTAISAGSYMLLHRDHGLYSGWGEPSYSSSNISSLTNVGTRLPFIFSINCQTGAYHRTSDCFTEKFHRYTYNNQNSGALGLVSASEVSYSFVNDAFIFGMFDNMWPNFMPAQTTNPSSRDMRPAFANVAGKYFLKQSSWAGNGTKLITYRLFHMHGEAFQWFYSEVPLNLAVNHAATINNTATTFSVSATTGSFIAITQETATGPIILGTATGTGSPVNITLTQAPTAKLLVTVTKQNYLRYSAVVNLTGSVAINETTEEKKFTIYPVPVVNSCVIEGLAASDKVQYVITDVTGREIKSGNINALNGIFRESISVESFASGIYYIKVTEGNKSGTQKLMVE